MPSKTDKSKAKIIVSNSKNTKDKEVEEVEDIEVEETKETKKSKDYKEVENKETDEKKVKMNHDTVKVGLNFDVKRFKNLMKTHYNQVHDQTNMKIMNAHYMLAAVNEVTLFNILTGVSHLFNKEKTGLLDLTQERLHNYILTTEYLRESFSRFLNKFDSQLDYFKLLNIDKVAKLENYITNYCFHNNQTISINKDTRNYLCFILAQINSNLSSMTYVIAKHGKKTTTVNVSQFRASVDIMFAGKLRDDINKKLDEINTILKNKPKQDSDKDSGEKKPSKPKSNNDEEENEEEDDEDEDDEDNEEDDEEDDDDKEECEDESEEEEKVVKSKNSKTVKGKSKNS